MRSILCRLLLLASTVWLALSSSGQTVNVTYTFQDYGLTPQSAKRITLTPLAPFGDYHGAILTGTPRVSVTDTSGSFLFTNVVSGYAYRIELATPYGVVTRTNGYPTGLSGNVNSTPYLGDLLGQTFSYRYIGTNFPGTAGQVFTTDGTNFYWAASAAGGGAVIPGTASTVVTNAGVFQVNVTSNLFDLAGDAQAKAQSATNILGPGLISRTAGVGTNITIHSLNDGTFSAALTLQAYPGNVNSSGLNLYSSGAASGSIIHYTNNEAKGVDVGLWSIGFGQPYSGSFVIDLYDLTGVNTLPGPQFKISAAGKSSVVTDSGVVDHPFLILNPTNGFTDFPMWRVDDRLGGPPLLHIDPLSGIQELKIGQTNQFTGSGTISAAGHTITGNGSTKFLTELTIGSFVFVGGNGAVIAGIASDSSATTFSPYTVSGGSSFVVQRPALVSRAWGSVSNFFVLANGSLLSIVSGGAGAYLQKDGSQMWGMGHGGSQLNLFNATLNANPFSINDSAPDSSVVIVASGALSLGQGWKAAGSSTNIGALTVQGAFKPEAAGPSAVMVTDSGTNLVAATLVNLTLVGNTLTAGGSGSPPTFSAQFNSSGGFTNIADGASFTNIQMHGVSYFTNVSTGSYISFTQGGFIWSNGVSRSWGIVTNDSLTMSNFLSGKVTSITNGSIALNGTGFAGLGTGLTNALGSVYAPKDGASFTSGISVAGGVSTDSGTVSGQWQLNGTFKITTGAAAGFILGSDSSGNAAWQRGVTNLYSGSTIVAASTNGASSAALAVYGHLSIVGDGTSPTIVTNTGAGGGGSAAPTVTGCDSLMTVTAPSGSTGAIAGAAYATITFSKAFNKNPICTGFVPITSLAGAGVAKFYVNVTSTTTAQIMLVSGVSPTTSATYGWAMSFAEPP